MSESEKNYSKLQWFFFVILIPAIFAVILFVIVMYVLGVNVGEKVVQVGSNIPYVSKFFVEEEEEIINPDELLEQIAVLQDEKENLEQKITQKDEEIEKLREEVRLQEEAMKKKEEESKVQEKDSELKQIAKTYESMSAKKAASIIEQLEINEAIRHISQLNNDTRAAILEKMDPEKAAQIVSRLAKQSN